jgi:hypothetical protein
MNDRYLFAGYFTRSVLQWTSKCDATSIVKISNILLTVQLQGLRVSAIKVDRLIG